MHTLGPGARHASRSSSTALALAVLAAVLFAGAMTAPLHYDDEQYVAGAYFARDHALYTEVLSLQPPLYTAIVSAVFAIVGDYYLLTAKLITWALAAGTVLLLHSLLRSLGTSRLAGIVLLLGFVLSPFAMMALYSSRNDIMPLFFLLMGLRLMLDRAGQAQTDRLLLFGAGLSFGLATAAKLTYLYAGPVALFWLWRRPGMDRRALGAFTLGGGVTALVMLPLIRDIDLMRFALLDFHQVAPFDWYRAEGRPERLEAGNKLWTLAQDLVLRGNASILLIGIAGIAAIAAGRVTGRHPAPLSPATGLLVLLTAGALILCFQPTPSHPMYFVAVAALGALLAGALSAPVAASLPPRPRAALLLATLVPALPSLVLPLAYSVLSLRLDKWTGIGAHRTAGEIAALIAEHGSPGPVATLFPIVALDANQVPREFATGPFVFRSGHLYPPERLAALNAISPDMLEARFSADPPAAIVGGFQSVWSRPMDAPLLDYAARHGYRLVKTDLGFPGYVGGQVWVRPRPAP